MATQALYRLWRSQRFADQIGQEAIITTLRNQVAMDRVAHAYLFCGSRGTGKTSTAKIMARAVNCQTPVDGEPCGVCAACKSLQEENNLDIVEIDAASNNGVDEIRDLREKVKYPPQHGRYRVYIIDEVHMLSTGAFNALLKTLEEPPNHVVFILATTEPQKLPATILSRCQRYDFRRIPAHQITGRLRQAAEGEHADVSEDALLLIARAAEGGMRDALSILDMCLSYGGGSVDAALVREVLGSSDRGFLFDFAAAMLAGEAGRAIAAVDALVRGGREVQVFCRDVVSHVRALLLAQTCGDALTELLECTQEDAAQYRAQAEKASRPQLLRLLDLFLAAENDMKWASQPRVALELAAVRGSLSPEDMQLGALVERLDKLERQFAQGFVVAATPAAGSAPAGITANPEAMRPAAKVAPKEKSAQQAPASDAKAIWERALAQLGKTTPRLFAPLKQGRFAGMEADVVRIEYAQTEAIFCEMLQQPERQEAIMQALAEAAGRPIGFEARVAGATPKSQAPDTAQNVQRAIDLFGRSSVQIVDE